MKKHKTRTVKYRRKRRGETDYKKRLKLLLSNKLRLVIRKSLSNIVAQIVEYHEKGDKVVVAVSSTSLAKFGWNVNKGNLPSAYLVGLLVGIKAKKNGIEEVVPDIGFNKAVKGSRVFAVMKGVVDAGVKIPHSKEILPDEERIKGAHIAKYAEEMKKSEAYEKLFSSYIKNNLDPVKISEYFEMTKKKILEVK
ncbi:MAG: 50S ribosomal protein L18 [Candidatus Woesearchaeota archaeon]|jgi:large subunit ribosomal protein L18|nr:50S ribosomal protein L18 [Candidatus Woesearchaeota archaeon]